MCKRAADEVRALAARVLVDIANAEPSSVRTALEDKHYELIALAERIDAMCGAAQRS